MKIHSTSLPLALIIFALSIGQASAEPKAKSSTSRVARISPENKINGILRPTDKDHNPSVPFHLAQTPAEMVLDEILRLNTEDNETYNYLLGFTYDASKNTHYDHLFTKEFVQAVRKTEADMVNESCDGNFAEGVCGLDFSPLTCAQDISESGYLYRTIEDDGHKAKIMMVEVDVVPYEIKIVYKLIKDGEVWKLDGNSCSDKHFNLDCNDTVCASDLPYFLKKAKQGDANAQYSLGIIYDQGLDTKWDQSKAAKWLYKAAEQGHAGAQSYLGYKYYHGYGVKQDDKDAVKWYRKAAEQGYAEAQYHLASMYQYGEGVTKDHTEYAKWIKKAAENAQAQSLAALGELYEKGTGVPQDFAEAEKWYRKAIALGDAEANFRLGMMYENGQGVQQDYAEAMKLYRIAASKYHHEAQTRLGDMYKNDLNSQAKPFSFRSNDKSGHCAAYVRRAMKAGGIKAPRNIKSAKDYNKYLLKNNFDELPLDKSYIPLKGDIVVFQPPNYDHKDGHIQMYNGKQWVSDFKQRGFWPGPDYRKFKPDYFIFRP